MPSPKKITVDLVIPVFNEKGIIAQTHARTRMAIDKLPYVFNFIYVDDGSRDGTADDLTALAKKDKRVRLQTLSRNFGHQAALTAGLDDSTGDIVISLDGDGQHPPEMIPQMLALIAQGYDVVQAQRMDDARVGPFKKWSSEFFYRILNFISGTQVLPGAADFRALSRPAVDALTDMPEYHRFLRGMVSWIGFKSAILPYHQEERVGGKSKYSLRKMFRLAMDALFSFSLAPLYVGLSLGGVVLLIALIQMTYVVSAWLTGNTTGIVPGWSSLMFGILMVGGILMVLLGFIGIYVGYIFQEVKQRPIYIVKPPEKNKK